MMRLRRDDVYAEWAPQRGHALLKPERKALRPWGFSAGSWKSLLNANWGFIQGGLACESTLHFKPPKCCWHLRLHRSLKRSLH
jgi:hypothetical protein